MAIPFYIPYALDHIGISESVIGTYTAVGATSAVLSNLLWVYVGDKYGSKSLLLIGSSLACMAPAIAIVAGYLSGVQQPIFYALVFILNQAFMNARGIGFMTYSLNMAPSISRPTYLGFLNTFMFPLSFIPVLSGWLTRVTSYETLFIISIATSVCAVYFAIKLSNVDERDDIESKDD
jgi:MFS family permease